MHLKPGSRPEKASISDLAGLFFQFLRRLKAPTVGATVLECVTYISMLLLCARLRLELGRKSSAKYIYDQLVCRAYFL